MQGQIANPFTFKGTKATVASLPSTGNTLNDTYYVAAETCLYSWDGDSWEVSSMKESDYMSILDKTFQLLGNLSSSLTPDNVPSTQGYYISPNSITAQYTGISETCVFCVFGTPAGQQSIQEFILSGGRIYTRYGNTGDFTNAVEENVSNTSVYYNASSSARTSASDSNGGLINIFIPYGNGKHFRTSFIHGTRPDWQEGEATQYKSEDVYRFDSGSVGQINGTTYTGEFQLITPGAWDGAMYTAWNSTTNAPSGSAFGTFHGWEKFSRCLVQADGKTVFNLVPGSTISGSEMKSCKSLDIFYWSSIYLPGTKTVVANTFKRYTANSEGIHCTTRYTWVGSGARAVYLAMGCVSRELTNRAICDYDYRYYNIADSNVTPITTVDNNKPNITRCVEFGLNNTAKCEINVETPVYMYIQNNLDATYNKMYFNYHGEVTSGSNWEFKFHFKFGWQTSASGFKESKNGDFKGTVTTDLLSNKIENGWWLLSENTTSEDLPFALSDIAVLRVFRSANHAVQIVTTIDGVSTSRDITIEPSAVGRWRKNTDSTLAISGAAADSKAVGDKAMLYRGGIDSGLLSDHLDQGWYIYYTTPEDAPFQNNNYCYVFNYKTASSTRQVVQDVFGRKTAYRYITESSVGAWHKPTEFYQGISNNRATFVDEMNKFATRIGLNNTEFADANGISRDNKTTARDLCYLGCYAANIDKLCRASSFSSSNIFVSGTRVTINNSTDFSVFSDKYDIIFTKTGYLETSPIVCNLVTVARERTSGIYLCGAVMNCTSTASRFTAMRALFDRTMQNINGETITITVSDCDNYCCGVFTPGKSTPRVLTTKGETEQFATASTAKVMSAILGAMYATNLGETVVARSGAISGGSGNNIATNDVISVYDLLCDMLLPSSNTAANVMADYIGDLIWKRNN